jgi:hypothetical protein
VVGFAFAVLAGSFFQRIDILAHIGRLVRRLLLTLHDVFARRRRFLAVGIERRRAPGTVREWAGTGFIVRQVFPGSSAQHTPLFRHSLERNKCMGVFGREFVRACIGRIANAQRQNVFLELVDAVHVFIVGLQVDFLRIAGGIDGVGRLLGFVPLFELDLVAVELEGGAIGLSNCQVPVNRFMSFLIAASLS